MQELLDNDVKPKNLNMDQAQTQNEERAEGAVGNTISTSSKFSQSALNGLFGKPINTRNDGNGVTQIVTTTQSHFTLEETQILLQEIMKNGNILFSNVPGMAKLKVDAWENMAELLHSKLPDTRRRPGIQLKKKWENVQMKTRKKILMKQEGKSIEMDTVDSQVIQIIATFFARKSISLTKDYNINKRDSFNTANITNATSSEKNNSTNTTEEGRSLPLHQNPEENNFNTVGSFARKRPADNPGPIGDNFLRFRPVNEENNVPDHSLLNSQLNADVNMTQLMASLISKSSQEKFLTDTLMEQLKQEHKIRIQTLHFQEVYWQLNLEALMRKCQMNGIPTDI